MAGFVERISVIIDTKVDGAVGAVKKFRGEVAAADGVIGKFKAGWSSIATSVKANAGAMASGAAVAFGVFATKAVNAFQDTALAAGRFSDATGIAVDDASRWIEVADDVGVSADTLQGAFAKMNKSIADGKATWSEFGVEITRTADGTVDANATFRDALTTIGAIVDPTLRAKAAQEVFGRSYGEVAELMEMSAEDLQAALESVGDEQVIDDDELKKAKKFRETMDEVSDALKAVQLWAGQAFVTVVNFLDSATDKAYRFGVEIRRSFDDDAHANWKIIDAFDDAESAAANFDRTLLTNAKSMDDVRKIVMDLTGSEHAANLVALEWKKSQDELNKVMDPQPIEDINAAFSDLLDTLSDEEKFNDAKDGFDDVAAAAQEAWVASAAGADDADRKGRAYANTLADLKRKVIDYAASVEGVPAERVTKIIAAIDRGDLDAAELAFNNLARDRTVTIRTIAVGGLTGSNGNTGNLSGSTGGVGVVKVESAGGGSRGGGSVTPALGGDQRGIGSSASPIVVQLTLDGRAIAEITAYQKQQERGTR